MNTAENAQIEEMFDSTHPGDAKKAKLDPGAGISNPNNSKTNAKSSCAAGCTIFWLWLTLLILEVNNFNLTFN